MIHDTWHVFICIERAAATAAAAAVLCVAILLLLLLLLLAAAVRHRVPDSKNCCWFIDSDSSVSFSSFKHDFLNIYPLTVLSHLRPRFANRGHVQSQGGRQPPAAKPPLHKIKRQRYPSPLRPPPPSSTEQGRPTATRDLALPTIVSGVSRPSLSSLLLPFSLLPPK